MTIARGGKVKGADIPKTKSRTLSESISSTEQGAVSEINILSPDLLNKLDKHEANEISQVILFDDQMKSIVGLR